MMRPSVLLELNLKRGVDLGVAKPAAVRAFSYVAPVSVRAGGDACSDLRMNVRLPQPYWPEFGEGADYTWDDVVLPWLRDKLYKVGTVIENYDRHLGEHGDAVGARYSGLTAGDGDALRLTRPR